MSKDNVVDIDDPFSYIFDNGVFGGVVWQRGNRRLLSIDNNGAIFCSFNAEPIIPKHELRQLMVMWLALNYPDCLRFDHLEKEKEVRRETK